MTLCAQVWHLLAEYGDATQLQALANFIKIHAHTAELQAIGARRLRRSVTSDELIHILINTGNNLAQVRAGGGRGEPGLCGAAVGRAGSGSS